MRPKHNPLVRTFALAATVAMIATTVALAWGSGVALARTNYHSTKGNVYQVGSVESLSYFDALALTLRNKTTLESPGDILTEAEVLHEGKATGVKCHSAGAKEGEIKTEPITVELGWINKAKGEVGVEEKPQNGTLIDKFTCGEAVIEGRGAAIGSITPINKQIKAGEHFTPLFAAKEGKQAITKFEGGPTVGYEAQVNGGGFYEETDEETGEQIPSPGTTLEISTASGKPEFVETTPPPTVVTEPASAVTNSSASLNATVNPNGGTVTECKLEYGTTISYGSSAPCTPSPGSGENAVAVSAAVGGLNGSTTYHFRISATNAAGTSTGPDETFTSAQTTWLCKPEAADPCERGLFSTVELANGSSFPESAEDAPNPPIDCFYVYPTVSSQPGENANLNDEPEEQQIAINQASRFSQTCKVYAPIYPQLTVPTITPPAAPGDLTVAAGDTAYNGVASAFKEYLEKYNDGRGFVLIGHSQGAEALTKLIKEQIDSNSALRKKMVSAILLGGQVLVPKKPHKPVGGSFQNVPACETAQETGCVVAYSSFLQEPPAGNPPSAGAIFGRTESGIYAKFFSESLDENPDEAQLKGLEVLCVNPADPEALWPGESPGALLRYESTSSFSPTALGPYWYWFQAPSGSTPWVSMPEQYSGQCKRQNGATWLQLTDVGPGTNAAQIAETLPPFVGGVSVWGTHLEDPNVALGNLVELTAVQSGVYQFENVARVTGITPTSGSTLGETTVTITGSDFLVGATVKIGNAATSVDVVSETEITAKTAATAAGSDEVVVTDVNGTSTGGPTYTYVTHPTYSASISSYEAEGKEAKFAEPNAVAMDSSGNIWVADSANDRIVEFNSKREYLRQFGKEGSGEGQFKGIGGIATNGTDLYVTDTGNHRVQEFAPSGEYLRSFGSLGSGEGQFITPSAIALDSSGDVWVLNSGVGKQIEEFSPEGKYISGFGSAGPGMQPLLSPTAIAFSGGNLYATEQGFERVAELSTSGEVLGHFGSKGSGNGQFYKPSAIATDPSTGNLYVTELGTLNARFIASPPSFVFKQSNNRVQELSPQGSFITAFGSSGSGPGQFLDGLNFGPKGVAVGPSGTIYVADTANKRVQEWVHAP